MISSFFENSLCQPSESRFNRSFRINKSIQIATKDFDSCAKAAVKTSGQECNQQKLLQIGRIYFTLVTVTQSAQWSSYLGRAKGNKTAPKSLEGCSMHMLPQMSNE